MSIIPREGDSVLYSEHDWLFSKDQDFEKIGVFLHRMGMLINHRSALNVRKRWIYIILFTFRTQSFKWGSTQGRRHEFCPNQETWPLCTLYAGWWCRLLWPDSSTRSCCVFFWWYWLRDLYSCVHISFFHKYLTKLISLVKHFYVEFFSKVTHTNLNSGKFSLKGKLNTQNSRHVLYKYLTLCNLRLICLLFTNL